MHMGWCRCSAFTLTLTMNCINVTFKHVFRAWFIKTLKVLQNVRWGKIFVKNGMSCGELGCNKTKQCNKNKYIKFDDIFSQNFLVKIKKSIQFDGCRLHLVVLSLILWCSFFVAVLLLCLRSFVIPTLFLCRSFFIPHCFSSFLVE